MLYLGRVLGGLASGVTCGAAPCYIGSYVKNNKNMELDTLSNHIENL